MIKTNRVTLRDIAERTGYTVNTVSRALHHRDDISKKTVDYICGYIIGRDLDSKPKRAKVTLIVSIVINLALLGVFKYYDFFAGTLNSLLGRGVFPTLGLTLPIGISFYTFQALSYTMDVYRGELPEERNFFMYALYVSFRRTSPHSAHTLRSFRSLSRDRSSATPTLTISCASARIR